MNTTMNAINWPKEYLPGLTDNYVSNEVIVKGITVEAVWEYLTNLCYMAFLLQQL